MESTIFVHVMLILTMLTTYKLELHFNINLIQFISLSDLIRVYWACGTRILRVINIFLNFFHLSVLIKESSNR